MALKWQSEVLESEHVGSDSSANFDLIGICQVESSCTPQHSIKKEIVLDSAASSGMFNEEANIFEAFSADSAGIHMADGMLSPLSASSLDPYPVYAVLDHSDLMDNIGDSSGISCIGTHLPNFKCEICGNSGEDIASMDNLAHLEMSFLNCSPPLTGRAASPSKLLLGAAESIPLELASESHQCIIDTKPPLPQLDWDDVQSQLPAPIGDYELTADSGVPSESYLPLSGATNIYPNIHHQQSYPQLSSSLSTDDEAKELYNRVLLTDCMLSSTSSHQGGRRRERCLSTTSSCGGAEVLAAAICSGDASMAECGSVDDISVSFRPDTPISEPDNEQRGIVSDVNSSPTGAFNIEGDDEATVRRHQLHILRDMMPAAELPPATRSPIINHSFRSRSAKASSNAPVVMTGARPPVLGGVRIVSRPGQALSSGAGRSLLKRNQRRVNQQLPHSTPSSRVTPYMRSPKNVSGVWLDRGDHSYSASQQQQRRILQRSAAANGGSVRRTQQQVYLLTPSPSQSESSSDEENSVAGNGSWCRRRRLRVEAGRQNYQQSLKSSTFPAVSYGSTGGSVAVNQSADGRSMLSMRQGISAANGLMSSPARDDFISSSHFLTPQQQMQRLHLGALSISNNTNSSGHLPPERRHNHNSMERMRRDMLRDYLHALRSMIPSTAGNERAAKVIVLREASKYCLTLCKKERQLARQKRRLQLRNQHLQQQLEILSTESARRHQQTVNTAPQ